MKVIKINKMPKTKINIEKWSLKQQLTSAKVKIATLEAELKGRG